MQRYFFHLVNGKDVLQDDMGEEFETAEEARQHAFTVASELGRNRPQHTTGLTLLVTDSTGVILLRTPLGFDYV